MCRDAEHLRLLLSVSIRCAWFPACMAFGDIENLCGTDNYFGLQERSVAVETLHTVAAEFKRCRADLQALLTSSEYPALEAFFSRCLTCSSSA